MSTDDEEDGEDTEQGSAGQGERGVGLGVLEEQVGPGGSEDRTLTMGQLW